MRMLDWQLPGNTETTEFCIPFCRMPPANPKCRGAFTLIELLVVIAILGLLAALTVPALKNFGRADVQMSAAQQMLGAVGRARQLAIANHTTVYLVFVTTNFFDMLNEKLQPFWAGLNTIPSPTDRQVAFQTASNLIPWQLRGYNFIAYGQAGDQPGRHAWHYLDHWRALPPGEIIAPEKFLLPDARFDIPQWASDYAGQIDNWRIVGGTRQLQIYSFNTNAVPFPTVQSPLLRLPCLAFNSFGQLISEYDGGPPDNPGSYHHAYIPLAQGTVGYGLDANKQPQPATVQPGDITENPPGNATGITYNVIDIDPLTGRATHEFHKVQ